MKARSTIALAGVLLLALAVAAGPARAVQPVTGPHATAAVSCKDCHGQDNPDSRAPMSNCFACHESYEAVAKRTESMHHNPHKSHLGNVRCDNCHKPHGNDIMYCNECHAFTDMKMKRP